MFLGDGSAFKGARTAPYPQPLEVKQLLLAGAKCVRSFLFAETQRFLSTGCSFGRVCFVFVVLIIKYRYIMKNDGCLLLFLFFLSILTVKDSSVMVQPLTNLIWRNA